MDFLHRSGFAKTTLANSSQHVTAFGKSIGIRSRLKDIEVSIRIPGYLNNAEGRKCVRWKCRSFDILSSLYISKLCSHKKLSCAVGAVCNCLQQWLVRKCKEISEIGSM